MMKFDAKGIWREAKEEVCMAAITVGLAVMNVGIAVTEFLAFHNAALGTMDVIFTVVCGAVALDWGRQAIKRYNRSLNAPNP